MTATEKKPGRIDSPIRVLVLSAQASRRRAVAKALMPECDVSTAEDDQTFALLLKQGGYDAVMLDCVGNGSCSDSAKRIRLANRDVLIVLLVENSACDTPHKPRDEGTSRTPQSRESNSRYCIRISCQLSATDSLPPEFRQTVLIAVENKRLHERIQYLSQELKETQPTAEIIGRSHAMDPVFEAAHAAASVTIPIMLIGEPGTGKELLARAIHIQKRNGSGRFCAVDCAAIPKDRIEREIFGPPFLPNTEPSALVADCGMLYFSNIESLPLEAQASVVRLLENQAICGTDGTMRHVQVRVAASSCHDLKQLLTQGTIRRDLYYHLNTMVIRIPPLRRRRDDIPLLAHHFMKRHAKRAVRLIDRISQGAIELLQKQRWTGNVRELDRAIELAVAVSRGQVLGVHEFAFLAEQQPSYTVLPTESPRDTAFDPSLFDIPYAQSKKQIVNTFTQAYCQEMMRRAEGNTAEASRLSGMDRSNFRKLARKGD